MGDPVAFLPGRTPPPGGPLARFLPPLPGGIISAWLKLSLPPGAWIVDPFGSSPDLAFEAARAGYRVLAAVNNPILRFLFERSARPLPAGDFQLALAELAATAKSGERLEPHLRGLYRTQCASCAAEVDGQVFVWEKGASAPYAKIYTCPNCKDAGERPTTPADAELAARSAGGALHRARALERVAPLDDPDRDFVEEALDIYPARAVYALFTLVNKLESFPAHIKPALEAMLLTAFDGAGSIWGYPPARTRPKQLTIPARYQERNVWLLLEDAAGIWPVADEAHGTAVALTSWPDLPPPEGGICLYEGRIRDLAASITAAGGASAMPQPDQPENQAYPVGGLPFTVSGVLTSLPRPNQAFWTLSALWSGWLWGPESSSAIKSVLRRRRYDWEWHADALAANLSHLASLLPEGAPGLALIPESEPGFLSAAVTAVARSHFELNGLAMRSDEHLSQLHLKRRSAQDHPAAQSPTPDAVRTAAIDLLRRRGEPVEFETLHAAVLDDLARTRLIPERPPETNERILDRLNTAIEAALSSNHDFQRFGSSLRSIESGFWWLAEPLQRTGEIAPPLADRVEIELVRLLLKNRGLSIEQIDELACFRFPGALTPSRDLVEACVRSYAYLDPDQNIWQLRPEDAPAARRNDLEQITEQLLSAGKRLEFRVEMDLSTPSRPVIFWQSGERNYHFTIIASAMLGSILPPVAPKDEVVRIIAIPGGRAALVKYKLAHNPQLSGALHPITHLLKFRHLRRLLVDPLLRRESFEARLDLDPLENKDPQMSLL